MQFSLPVRETFLLVTTCTSRIRLVPQIMRCMYDSSMSCNSFREESARASSCQSGTTCSSGNVVFLTTLTVSILNLTTRIKYRVLDIRPAAPALF